MIKCYHVRRIELVVDTEPQLFFQGPVIAPLIATIDSDDEDVEDIWYCCNNSCWWDHKVFREMKDYKGKFKVDFTDDYIGFCNDDLIIENGNKYWLAEEWGWKDFYSFESALKYAKKHAQWVRLHKKSEQYPEGKELTMDELNTIKDKYEKENIKCFIMRD